jgi:hypothetical protein
LSPQQVQQGPHARNRSTTFDAMRRHGRKPRYACTAQQLQQDRFGLIVGVMCKPERGCAMTRAHRIERAIARVARSRLDADPRLALQIHAPGIETRAERACRRLTVSEPPVGIRAQPVVNMQGNATRRARYAYGRIEQHTGIKATAECDGNRRIGGQRRKHAAKRIEYDALGGWIDV